MDAREESFNLFMLPWLAHGHISPYLELAKRLTKRNFHIYFCSTPVNLEAIKPNLSEDYSVSIQLVEIHLQSTPELPPRYHTTKGLPPHLMPKLTAAFQMAAPELQSILKTLNPDLLIIDILQPWVLPLASSLDIPMILFHTSAAVVLAFLLNRTDSSELQFPELELHECWKSKNPNIYRGQAEPHRVVQYFNQSSGIILIKTSREIEAKYVDFLASSFTNKVMTTGPLVQLPAPGEDEKYSDIVEWLDNKEPFSTVLVSFGSEYYLSGEETEEIAHGLEISQVNFIWVVRSPMGQENEVKAALPEGFIERTGERGKVVEGWVPQLKILAHPSTGGFVSHCGWSSLVECMMYSVPVIGAPMQLDNPMGARLVEEIGVGLEIKRDEEGRIRREEVADAIKKVIMEKTGESFRRKVKDISSILKVKDDEEVDSLASELVKLCEIKMEQVFLPN